MFHTTPNPHVIFDLDDVLADFWPPVLKRMMKKYPTAFPAGFAVADLIHYDSVADYISGDLFKEVAAECFHEMPLIPAMVRHLDSLARDGAEISIVTARGYCETAHEATLLWLDCREIPFDRLVITNHQKEKSGGYPPADYIVEDNHFNIIKMVEHGHLKKGGHAYLVDRPWNRKEWINHIPFITRIDSNTGQPTEGGWRE